MTFSYVPYSHTFIKRTRDNEIGLWIVINTEHVACVPFQSSQQASLPYGTFISDQIFCFSPKVTEDLLECEKHTDPTSHILIVVSSEPEQMYLESDDHEMSEMP